MKRPSGSLALAWITENRPDLPFGFLNAAVECLNIYLSILKLFESVFEYCLLL
jgi:hypothetical protein